MIGRKKLLLAIILAALVLGTIGVGLFYEHYFVVFVFAVWLSVEFFFRRVPVPTKSQAVSILSPISNVAVQNELARLYQNCDRDSDRILNERTSEIARSTEASLSEKRWAQHLSALLELRALCFGELGRGLKHRLRAYFSFVHSDLKGDALAVEAGESSPLADQTIAIQQITETATYMADLYWRLYAVCTDKYPDLTEFGRSLFVQIWGEKYTEELARARTEQLCDSMQRDYGLPYFVLNLIRRGDLDGARSVSRELLRSYDLVDIDEEIRSSLYWMAEIRWFLRDKQSVAFNDYESCIRYLYHLCFTNPDRAGFLEIDSRFFSQFETITELAQEGFLFKEILVDKILMLWKEHDFLFDPVFQPVLECMTRMNNKIYDERETWIRYWGRERENFSKEYLFVVEGNLCYAAGHYQDAVQFYQKALSRDPKLRSALLNLLFCYAKLNDPIAHEKAVGQVLNQKELVPGALHVIGDSYFLIGDAEKANAYYEKLKDFEGWENRIDHYKSTFCYENKMFEQALHYAKKAFQLNPNDPSMSYQLSLCYDAVGEKDLALDMVKKMGDMPSPTWLNYYKFTLERATGKHNEASRTLLGIPREYFEDPEELNEAVEFARSRRDLVLLRHLRRK